MIQKLWEFALLEKIWNEYKGCRTNKGHPPSFEIHPRTSTSISNLKSDS